MPFAAALSRHPDPAVAVGEVAGQLLDTLGPDPDLVLVFLSGGHALAASDIAGALTTLLGGQTLIGATSLAVSANGREVEDSTALAAWAGRFGPVHSFTLDPADSRMLEPPPFTPRAILLLSDPFSAPADQLLAAFTEQWPDVPVIGGSASSGRGPGGNRLLFDAAVTSRGAVGAFVGPGLQVVGVVSQGCTPVGQPFVVTAAEGNIVRELGGQPAMARLRALTADELTAEQVDVINQGGLHLGVVADEHLAEYGRGDFLVQDLLGANAVDGSIAVAQQIRVGTTVQFQVRDAETADDDLRALLTGHHADSALVFPTVGRGRSMFPSPDHDAAVIEEFFGRVPAAGMFCASALGPVAGRNNVHDAALAVALLREVRGGR